LFPSAFTGRAVPSEGCLPPDHPAAALVGLGYPSPVRFALAVFRACVWHCLRCSTLPDAARAGHSCPVFRRHTSRARVRAVLATWPERFHLSGDAPGIFIPFAVFFRTRVMASWVVRRLDPTCRFASLSAASFIVRGTHPMRVTSSRVGRGSWGLAPRATRSLRPAGPAIAFVHRADRVHRSQLPWVFSSSLGS